MGSHKSSPAPGFTHLTPWSLEGLLPAPPKAASCALPRGPYPSAEPGSLFSNQRSKSRDFIRLHLSPWPRTQGLHLRIHYLLVKREGRTHSVRSCLCREPGGTTGSTGCVRAQATGRTRHCHQGGLRTSPQAHGGETASIHRPSVPKGFLPRRCAAPRAPPEPDLAVYGKHTSTCYVPQRPELPAGQLPVSVPMAAWAGVGVHSERDSHSCSADAYSRVQKGRGWGGCCHEMPPRKG